jgi:hypothetical protein
MAAKMTDQNTFCWRVFGHLHIKSSLLHDALWGNGKRMAAGQWRILPENKG